MMIKCNLCPNACGADRTAVAGACGVKNTVRIAKYYPHMYEEPPVSGTKGSGAVFFCGCGLKCVFCQNYAVSRGTTGKDITIIELAEIFKELENCGVHNINLVNPTHYADVIIKAFEIYRPKIPVVWNSHGYERVEILKRVDEYVDIYLPDMKFFSPEVSARYTGKKNYFEYASQAIEFMTEKPYVIGDDGMLKSGTIVRHLVLPQNINDTLKILDWFTNIKDKAALSLMSQYTPYGEITDFPELQRKLTKREYEKAVNYALSLGIENIFVQSAEASGTEYIPEWDY